MTADDLDRRRSRAIGRLATRISLRIGEEVTADTAMLTAAQKSALIQVEVAGCKAFVLAKRLGISKQATSKLVKELEDKGFVTRAPDPADQRSAVILVTQKGRTLVETTLAAFDRVEAKLRDGLGEERLEALRRDLAAAATILDPDGF